MKIETEKKLTHGEFAKYMVDKFGVASFECNLAGGEWFGAPSDIYNASINLKPSKYDDFPHNIRISEDSVTLKTFEEITEDTVIPKMVEIYLDKERDIPYSQIHYNQTINQAINTQECGSKSFTFNKIEDDGTHTLIWRNGALVEEE